MSADGVRYPGHARQAGRSWQRPELLVVRAPLLPADAVASSSPTDLWPSFDRGHWMGARQRAREVVGQLLLMPIVLEALYLASPSLVDAIPAWRDNPDSTRGQKVERSLVKYLARMAGRCTPFGLFAGIAVGRFGDLTNWQLSSRQDLVRCTRVDGGVVHGILERRLEVIAGDGAASVYPNPSAWTKGGTLRYVELAGHAGSHVYQQVEVETSPELLFALAANKELTIDEHTARLLDQGGFDSETDARDFVHELVCAQLLLPRQRLRITGDPRASQLFSDLEQLPATHDVAVALQEITRSLQAIDLAGGGSSLTDYKDAALKLSTLDDGVHTFPPFQVDVLRPLTTRALGAHVEEEFNVAVELLCRVGRGGGDTGLTKFASAFQERYGHCRMPLLEVLDEDIGIGFGTAASPDVDLPPHLVGLPFAKPAKDTTRPFGQRERWLLEQVQMVRERGARELALSPLAISAIENTPLPILPDAFELTASVRAESVAQINSGDFRIVVTGLEGPSGARLLGRFSHLHPEVESMVLQHCRAEEALLPDAVFAEVVFLPENVRLWNVVARPHLRDYEIPYLGNSGISSDRIICPSDLSIAVDFQGTVRLFSETLQREVVPRITTAHNLSRRNTTVYRFLGALISQNCTRGLAWNWGALDSLSFLPRVVIGRVVLSRARWRLKRADCSMFDSTDGFHRYRQLVDLRRRLGLPRHVYVAEGESQLPIDLDNPLSADLFVDCVARQSEAVISEVYPEPDQCGLWGPDGRYSHEVVVPFVRTSSGSPKSTWKAPAPVGARRHLPGSDWIYCKLYCSAASSDRVLASVLQRLGSSLPKVWYFVRYLDPGFHIRLRLKSGAASSEPIRRNLLDSAAQLERDGLVWKFQFDTYEPEIERYGGSSAQIHCEELFAADSRFVATILPLTKSDSVMRWLAALASVSQLLDDLEFDLEAKHTFAAGLRDQYYREFKVERQGRLALARRYRGQRELVSKAVSGRLWVDDLGEGAAEAVRLRSFSTRESWRRARSCLAQPDHAQRVVASVVHMAVNRVLLPPLRESEVVLYDFLALHWQGEVARTMGRVSNSSAEST